VIKRIKLYLSIFPFLPLSEVSHNNSHVDLNFSLFLILWQRWNVDNVTYIDPLLVPHIHGVFVKISKLIGGLLDKWSM
jgi:hypothetical protein